MRVSSFFSYFVRLVF